MPVSLGEIDVDVDWGGGNKLEKSRRKRHNSATKET